MPEELPLPAHDQALVENVLRAWRDEDTQEFDAAAPQAPGLAEPQHEAEPVFELAPVAAPADARAPAAQHALEPDLVDGLSESACEQLHAEGVHTLESLIETDLGRLALHSGLGYSRLYRWRSLAERRLRSRPAETAIHEEVRLSPAESPAPVAARDLLGIPGRGLELPHRALRWSPVEEGAAGPFA